MVEYETCEHILIVLSMMPTCILICNPNQYSLTLEGQVLCQLALLCFKTVLLKTEVLEFNTLLRTRLNVRDCCVTTLGSADS
jgi:hypothetical protein